MKPLWIAIAVVLSACQVSKTATQHPATDKVRSDADNQRKSHAIQEQLKGINER
jgi:hypothetical protein